MTSSGDPHKRNFTFDYVYGEDSTQYEVFEHIARPIVDCVLSGYNGTIFAYGQTGTGKTFTMEGKPDDPDLRGIMPNSFYYIIDAVGKAANNMEFLVRASFLEIYNDDVYDLLNHETRRKMQAIISPVLSFYFSFSFCLSIALPFSVRASSSIACCCFCFFQYSHCASPFLHAY